ncbi:MFS general substrate transporter [Aspergillus japonicus CBS 114.51]|uniref:MFS general substrate transporter n=1 Tax=Aspergillus japonicus CBS 114.51 TaxID=1448312 RepID=A0A8T8X135_ASPJA|nr:MFS general substrate transporter [Aspergillus japonicus CBS 114.51]RAH81610.1 MFS general substrate transporter [Aspergillus japonicus CBS 114.51]
MTAIQSGTQAEACPTQPLPDEVSEHSIAQGEPPNGGYGWVCVACISLINAHTWGMNGSYGVFLAHYIKADIFPGTSSLIYALIGGLTVSMCLVISPVGALTTRRWGTQATLLIGVAFQTVGLVAASFCHEIWQLVLSQGLCFGWGMGLMFVASFGIPAQWFTTKRSLASGFATCGSALGGLIYSLGANAMIENISLPWAFRILAIVSLVVNFGSSLFLRDRNTQTRNRPAVFKASLLKNIDFLLVLLWAIFSLTAYIIVLFSIPDYGESEGLSADQGALLGALVNLGQVVGRPGVGFLSDRLGRLNVSATFARQYASIVGFSIVIGLFIGTFWASLAPLVAEVLGLHETINGLNICWMVLVSPITGLLCYICPSFDFIADSGRYSTTPREKLRSYIPEDSALSRTFSRVVANHPLAPHKHPEIGMERTGMI